MGGGLQRLQMPDLQVMKLCACVLGENGVNVEQTHNDSTLRNTSPVYK